MDSVISAVCVAIVIASFFQIRRWWLSDPYVGVDPNIPEPVKFHPFWGVLPYRDNEVRLRWVFQWAIGRPIMKIHAFKIPFLVVSEPALIQEVIQNPAFAQKEPRSYQILGRFIGSKSTLVTHGPEYTNIQRLIQPIFHRRNMEDYFYQTMIDSTEDYATKIATLAPNSDTAVEGLNALSTIDIDHYNTMYTLDIIMRCMFGVRFETGADDVSNRVEAGAEEVQKQISNLFYALSPLARYRSYIQVRDMRKDFLNIIESKKKNPNDGTKRKDLADMLIEARDPDTGKPIDDEVIIDQFLTLMLAGHDTTAHTLTWILHMLSERPDAEEKLLKEIETALNGRTQLSYSELTELKYMDAIVKETMRIFPAVYAVGRCALYDTRLGKYEVKAGTKIMINILTPQLTERFYNDPTGWNPDRWMTAETFPSHSYAWMPFSKGERSCVGQRFALLEIRVALLHLLPRFKFKTSRLHSIKLERRITTQGVVHMTPEIRTK
ncbi:Unspecific monooxygenase [Planoprotostelium fungivorum]|uniref:Unspecific monooxygenase n=1 Tax=Planoprotostelium fungivorum TaxID=1890364 RepID=A0A2P6ND57_9EUKA|nr:Unspecific monooxygenase [Planoprotostelium fungivorum]